MANLYNRAIDDVLEEVAELFLDIKEDYASYEDDELLNAVLDIEEQITKLIERCRTNEE